MEGLNCKRCNSPDSIEELCESCDAIVYERTARLIQRGRDARDRASEIFVMLGVDGVTALTDLANNEGGIDISEENLIEAFSRYHFESGDNAKKLALCFAFCREEEARQGYAELATISRRAPTDDEWIKQEIMASTIEGNEN
jgi:hypothetical protein